MRVLGAILCFLVAAVLMAGGGIAMIAEQGVQNYLEAEVRGDIPGSASFTAEARRYNVLLNLRNRENRRVRGSFVTAARCEARLSDGSVKRMDGRRQGTSVSGPAPSIGAFTATAGRTEVRCAWDRERSELGRFTVAPVNETIRTLAFVAIGVGGLILLLGFWILFGHLLRRRPKGPPPPPIVGTWSEPTPPR